MQKDTPDSTVKNPFRWVFPAFALGITASFMMTAYTVTCVEIKPGQNANADRYIVHETGLRKFASLVRQTIFSSKALAATLKVK